jgi:predicted DNA-binding antitoxin AbrB/MazE fold protein
MIITVDAVVVNGLLKPMKALPLEENEQVRITIQKESIPKHTGRALNWEEMAQELDKVSRPVAQANVPLKHKVDYSQVS